MTNTIKSFRALALFSLLFFFVGVWPFFGDQAFEGDWHELKGTHFVVLYSSGKETSETGLAPPKASAEAGKILRKAEEYYDKIANQIGFSRYTNFWTWEDRVKIYMFADQEEFIKETSQPAWSRGYVVSDTELFDSRMIVTYLQEEDFAHGLLPHEISHLILQDFIGPDRVIPMWFDEGVAQLQETEKKELAYRLMKRYVGQQRHIPLATLERVNIRREKDQQKVSLFYAQSLTIIDFLLKNYGSAAFGNLCRHLKEGKTMSEALSLSYGPSIKSFVDLEEKWMRHIESH